MQSVKHKLKIKSRNPINGWGRDSVRFKEKNGWFKHVKIRLRNVSGRPIYGLSAAFHFEPPGQRTLVRLLLRRTRNLEREPLQAGDEIELDVSDESLRRTKARMGRLGADLDLALVSFSVDSALFSNNLMWSRGVLLRRDPNNPNKWDAVDQPPSPGAGQLKQPAFFKLVGFKPVTFRPQNTCQQAKGGELGFQCPGDFDSCNRIHEVGNGNPGNLSLLSMIGDCERIGVACEMDALHDRLVEDSNCQPCPDADGDGFQDQACGGNDCNDNPNQGGANINPNASENCSDGVDNNCDALTDGQDPCSCGGYEGDLWLPGGEIDCTLCHDGTDNDCDDDIDTADNGCSWFCTQSPVVIDVAGNGFNLTDAANGVNFDLNSDGTRERLSWTAPQADDAWLALDRNGNGTINNGSELFGNFTPQPNPPPGVGRNGFNALAVYDRADKGGNGDGLISTQDAIFASLRMWQDANHNGISEASELRTLQQLGLKSIDCDYKESRQRDQHGKWFRYRAKVRDMRDAQLGRWAWDVFLVGETGAPAKSTVRHLPLFQFRVPSLTIRTGFVFDGKR